MTTRILFFLLIALSITAFSIMGALAADSGDIGRADLQVFQIRTYAIPTQVTTYVGVENMGSRKLEDLKVSVVIPDLGVRGSSGPFDLRSGSDDMRMVPIDLYGAPSGEYVVRITITGDDVRRVRHRLITIP